MARLSNSFLAQSDVSYTEKNIEICGYHMKCKVFISYCTSSCHSDNCKINGTISSTGQLYEKLPFRLFGRRNAR